MIAISAYIGSRQPPIVFSLHDVAIARHKQVTAAQGRPWKTLSARCANFFELSHLFFNCLTMRRFEAPNISTRVRNHPV
jgi:hypothetical protein